MSDRRRVSPLHSVRAAVRCAWGVALVIGAVAAGALAAHVARANAAASALRAPVAYLLHAQNADGGFGPAPGQRSDQLFAGWAALGLASAGERLSAVDRGPGLLSYVRAGAGTRDVGSLERTILVARAAGASATSFGGHDLVAELRRRFSANGSVSGQVNLTAFGILALRAAGAGADDVTRGRAWLLRQQGRDGGFGFAGGGASSDVDDTGAALEALAGQSATAGAASARRRAVAYLRAQQDGDGGFPSQPGTGSNAQSTAWAIQGLDAAGVDPAGLRRGGTTPVAYLRSLVAPGGAIRYAHGSAQTPVWVTGEALMALAGRPLPFAPPPAPAAPARHRARRGAVTHSAAPRSHAVPRRRHAATAPRSRPARVRPAHAPAAPGARHPAAPSRSDVVATLARAYGALSQLALAPLGLG